MKVAGIIAEYNPFHNGHKLLVQKVREAGYTHIVAVMSGNFVQRGEPAVFHHSVRTKAALENGVDLVLQLPSVYAMSGAQSFARAGAEILDGLGITDSLAFGSECGDVSLLSETADAVYGEEIKPLLVAELEKGISFASARENALRKINPEFADVIKSPNNILGVEYIAALKKLGSDIKPITFERIGAAHDSDEAEGNIAGASLIREKIRNGGEWANLVPEAVKPIYDGADIADTKKMENAVLYKIRTVSADELAKAPDISEGIENRIILASGQARSLDELYSLAKTKRYSHARIRRIIWNCVLGVTADDLELTVPYIRITGFNKKGAELIRAVKSTAKLPLISKPADLSRLDEAAQRVFSLECMAGDIYGLCTEKPSVCGTEKRLRPVIGE